MRVQEFKVTIDGDGELGSHQVYDLVGDALRNMGYTVDVVETTEDDLLCPKCHVALTNCPVCSERHCPNCGKVM